MCSCLRLAVLLSCVGTAFGVAPDPLAIGGASTNRVVEEKTVKEISRKSLDDAKDHVVEDKIVLRRGERLTIAVPVVPGNNWDFPGRPKGHTAANRNLSIARGETGRELIQEGNYKPVKIEDEPTGFLAVTYVAEQAGDTVIKFRNVRERQGKETKPPDFVYELKVVVE